MKKYSIGQFAKKINKTQQTLRNSDKNGYRYYTEKKTKAMIKELVDND